MRGRKYTQEEILFLKEFYPEYGSKYCSEKLNRNRDAIITMCNRLKIKCKHKSYHKKNSDRNVNPELFYNITSNTIAYFLGLLWGDGYLSTSNKIYQIRVESLKKDGKFYYEILSQFGKWKKYTIKKNKNGNRNNKPQLVICIGNKPLHSFLIKNDYKKKSKASPSKILSQIPTHLHNYFWRGFLDADGCIYINNEPYKKKRYISFTGSYNQKWNDLTKLLDSLEIKYLYRKTIYTKNGKTSRCSRILIHSKENIKAIGNYLYKNYEKDKIGLPRKFKKFQEILKYYDAN